MNTPDGAHVVRFSQLSSARQALVRLCQRLNFGQIHHMRVQDGDPLFDPEPLVFIHVRLDTDNDPRLETQLKDFELRNEVVRLMASFDHIKNGVIERIDVRAGLPCRIVFEFQLQETLR